MNLTSKKLLSIAMLLSVSYVAATTQSGTSVFLPRAQNATAAELLGWAGSGAIHKYDMDDFYLSAKVQTEYNQNWSRDKIGTYLTSNNTNQMIFGNINTAGTTNTTDVWCVNFLLPTVTATSASSFNSTVKFSGKTQSSVTDLSFYAGLDSWMEGLFATLHVPLIWNRFEVILTETVNVAAPATYQTATVQFGATPNAIYTTVKGAFVGNLKVGDVLNTWSYGRINGARSKFGAGDIVLSLGYDFVNKENSHLGIGIRGLFGTGGKTKSQYVLEPVFGHAGRMGVGGLIDGHAVLWDKDEDNQLSVWGNANVVHLFSNEQTRNYDLTGCGKWSRYLLVQKVTPNATAANTNFLGVDNMINIGARTAKIGIDAAYDATVLFDYHYNNFNIEAGYNIGGHSAEKHEKFTGTAITTNQYILYNPVALLVETIATGSGTALSAQTIVAINGSVAGSTAANLTTANQGTYCLSDALLDTASALAPSVIAHTVFGGVNYTFRDTNYAPSIGVYGKAEICGKDNNSLNQWGVGAQFNISF